MAQRTDEGSGGNRPLDLTGESPELIAFGLLRYLAQLEQQDSRQNGTVRVFDRKWMLDAYAECLEAAKGQRRPADTAAPVAAPAALEPVAAGRGRRSK